MPERYEFIRKIAQGGFGRVYVAKDTRLGREVAIKRLLSPEESAAYDQAQATFEREATTLAAMQHPNIVQIYDFDHDDEGTFVVMEMLEGETLKDRLNRGPLTWETFVNVVRQSLDAINAAHLKDILHRDLKPENLYLVRTPSGTRVLKILDFGLAKLSNVPSRQTMDQSGNVFGSIYYMAPEQFMREPLDGRTDLYALGCVFYQALTARFPFYGDNMQGTMEAHMQHDVRPIREKRPDLSAPVCDWLMRLISYKPEDRPADAMSAMREFESALEGKTFQPPPKEAIAKPVTAPAPMPKRPGIALPQPARMAAGPATARPTGPPTARPGTPATAKPGTPPTSRPSGPAPASGMTKTPMQNRAISALEVSRAEARAKMEVRAKRRRLAIMIGAPIAGIAVVAFALWRPKAKKVEPVKAPTAKVDSKNPPAPAKATPKKAATPAPTLPDPVPLTLPMEASLVWRVRAGAESQHRDAKGKLETGKLPREQTVQFWRNLASPEKTAGLTPYEGKGERSPAGRVTEVNGPGTSHGILFFATRSGMETKFGPAEIGKAPGAAGANPPGVTVAAVFHASAASKEKTMRPILLSSDGAKQTFSLHFSHKVGQYWAFVERDGQVAQSLVTPEQFAKGAGGNWAVVVATWDAKQGTVNVRVRSPDGKTTTGTPSPIPPGISVINRINVGFVSLPKESKLDPNEKFDGDIIEMAVYGQALDAATQDKVVSTLWDRYFKKR